MVESGQTHGSKRKQIPQSVIMLTLIICDDGNKITSSLPQKWNAAWVMWGEDAIVEPTFLMIDNQLPHWDGYVYMQD